MAERMFLYWGSGSGPCWRVMIALEEKGFSGYGNKLLSFQKGEHKSDEVMQLNPRGTLPTFKDGDLVFTESMAAVLHLEMTYPDKGNTLLPTDGCVRGKVLQRYFEFSQNLDRKISEVFYYFYFLKEEERDPNEMAKRKKALREEWQRWEGYLEQSTSGYLVGSSFTIADVALFSVLGPNIRFGFPVNNGKTPKLAEFYNRLKDRPSIVASWPPHYKEGPPTSDLMADV